MIVEFEERTFEGRLANSRDSRNPIVLWRNSMESLCRSRDFINTARNVLSGIENFAWGLMRTGMEDEKEILTASTSNSAKTRSIASCTMA